MKKMNDLKIRNKMQVIFGITIICCIVAVCTSLWIINGLSNYYNDFYNITHKNAISHLKLGTDSQIISKELLESITTKNNTIKNESLNIIDETLKDVDNLVSELEKKTTIDRKLFLEFKSSFVNFKNSLGNVKSLSRTNDNNALSKYYSSFAPKFKHFNNNVESMIEQANSQARIVYKEFNSKAKISYIVLISIVLIMVVVISIIINKIVGKYIEKPLLEIEEAAKKMSMGHTDVKILYTSEDEIGKLANSLNITFVGLKNIIDDEKRMLSQIAEGNFNIETNSRGNYILDYEPLLVSMYEIRDKLSRTLGDIKNSAEQVNSGADQVATGAQALSQGATEQAASVEELSATIMSIADGIEHTANNSNEANQITIDTAREIENGKDKMKLMINAMKEISEKSNEIGNIIKTIDNIAFQTNILALNAAVEAARAGSAGQGFAVVADEVRNLAQKAAEAAKGTTELIEKTVEAVNNGSVIANETNESFNAIVEMSNKVEENINKIAQAANEQSHAVGQVKLGVEQISSVVQTNSATSEESAAASQELKTQAELLDSLVSNFVIVEVNEYNS